MKVEIETTKRTKKKVEVEFPVYMKGGDFYDSGTNVDWRYRLESDGTLHQITKRVNRDDEVEYEVSVSKEPPSEWGQYIEPEAPTYQRGTAKDFDDMLAELTAFVEGLCTDQR